jgi:hypothetical protein
LTRLVCREAAHCGRISQPPSGDFDLTKPVHRLYGSPSLIPGEAIGTWLYRVAAYHRIEPRLLLRMLGLGHSLHSLDFGSPFKLPTAVAIASLTLNPLDAILAAISPPMHIAADREFRCLTVDLAAYAPIYRVCPCCLAEDPTPYIRRSWRLAYNLVCNRHPQPLMSQCPICQYRLDYSGDRLRDHARIDRTTVIRHCPHCSFSLARAITRPLASDLWKRLAQFQDTLHGIVTSGLCRHPHFGTISAAKVLENYLTREQLEVGKRTISRFSGIDFRRCFGIHADQVLEAISPHVEMPLKHRCPARAGPRVPSRERSTSSKPGSVPNSDGLCIELVC